ncbi:AmmeMemoRadiSam system protein B, partial [bacterium]
MKKWLIILSLLFITCENKGVEMVREPAVAGQFYPGNPSDLKEMIQRFLDNSKIETGGKVIG